MAPWREDIRYTPRKAGYHGGASPAEVTVPVIVLVPSQDLKPANWAVLPNERVVPTWWHTRAEPRIPVEELEVDPARKTRRRTPAQDGEGCSRRLRWPRRAGPDAGRAGCRSDRYRAQKAFVRRPPDAKAVVAVIDALVAAGGKLTPDAVAAAAAGATGRSQRNAEIFVTVVQRLLNVEGYGVINLVEAGRTVELNVPS